MLNDNEFYPNKPKALIVGINRYEEYENLHKPAANANRMDGILKKDFDVEKHSDSRNPVTKKELKQYINKHFVPGGKPNKVLFYFSGYVDVKNEGIEEIFLVTYDSNPSEDYELGVSLRWLRQILEESNVKEQIIILDCCYPTKNNNGDSQKKNNLEIDKFIPGYQSGKDRCFMILFSKEHEHFINPQNQFLFSNRKNKRKDSEMCSPFTAEIVNYLSLDIKNDITYIDNKTLIKKLKQADNNGKKWIRYGDYKRIYFGKKIDILGDSTKNIPTSGKDKENPYKGLESFTDRKSVV